MRITFWHKKIEIFSISKCIYCPLSRINTAFLVVSFYDFNTYIKKFIHNTRGATIRGHQIATGTIPAHNFGLNKFLHPSAITKFYIHFFLLKTQVHILQKSPLTRINSRFLRQQANSLHMTCLWEHVYWLYFLCFVA